MRWSSVLMLNSGCSASTERTAVRKPSTKAGFSLQVLHGKPTAVTSSAYKGSHDVTLQLKPGRWFFYTPGGKKSVFFVTS